MQANQFTNSFKSITQYDKRFDGMFDNIKNKGFSCSYFGILTCLRFLQGYTPDVDTHEKNIIDAMTITCLLDVNSGLSFENLILGCTNYDQKKIIGTSVELIVNNVIGPNEMFPKLIHQQEKYAVMFLKNEKYFAVLVDSDGFYLRDCHVDIQYNFNTLDSLFTHLSSFYQFTSMINIDGFQIEEYSSIEFLIFDQQFESDIVNLLETQIVSAKPKINIISTQIKKKEEMLNGDILNVPEKTLFSKKDIEYLQQLNNELSTKSGLLPNPSILGADIIEPSQTVIETTEMTEMTEITKIPINSTIETTIEQENKPKNELQQNNQSDLTEDEKLILLELQKELDELDNAQFVNTLLMDSVSPDDMVDFR